MRIEILTLEGARAEPAEALRTCVSRVWRRSAGDQLTERGRRPVAPDGLELRLLHMIGLLCGYKGG